MNLFKTAIAATVIAGATAAAAQDDFKNVLKARQGQMWLQAINLGILGGMAKGKMDYDAAKAQAAADSLVGISMIDQAPLWPQGSDNMSIDGTRALPAAWDKPDDVMAKWMSYVEAAKNMQAVAGTGREALGPAMGKLGGACKACHDAYRAPKP